MNQTEQSIVDTILADIKKAAMGERTIAVNELNTFLDAVSKRISLEVREKFPLGQYAGALGVGQSTSGLVGKINEAAVKAATYAENEAEKIGGEIRSVV